MRADSSTKVLHDADEHDFLCGRTPRTNGARARAWAPPATIDRDDHEDLQSAVHVSEADFEAEPLTTVSSRGFSLQKYSSMSMSGRRWK